MEQRPNNAVLKDAQTLLRREECALSMEQRKNTNDAAVKGVHVWLKREECALSTGQMLNTNDAAVKDAQTLLKREDGAKVKRCSFEGCTNQSQRRGVCWRHGANRNPHEFTAFTSCFDQNSI